MNKLKDMLLEECNTGLERYSPEELAELCDLLDSDDQRRISYLIAIAKREISRSLVIKMLKSLDNDEKINNAPPIEVLNCIEKILKIDQKTETELSKLVFKKINSSFNIKEIKRK